MAAPTVTIQAAVPLTYSSEALNGSITVAGVGPATVQGFNVGLTTSYGTVVSQTGSFSPGAFGLTVTGLVENTLYHVQAFATNADGTGVSADATFTTVKNPKTNYSGTVATPFILGVD